MRFRYFALLGLGLFLSPVSHAARPMVTDDARIVDDKSCQLETWLKASRASEEYWAIPSCNFSGNFELAVGGAVTHAGGASQTSDLLLQGKTLFRTLETNGWAWGLTAGFINHPDLTSNMVGDTYAYIPATFSFRDDKVLLHTNLGWAHTRNDHRDAMTWGVGTELEMTSRTWLIGEGYGENQGRPFYQLGLRHWIIPNRVQIDATYGNRSSGGESWFSIGLRLLSLPFLP
ncbi:MAG TPA: hypothetical protein VN066_07285 [Rhodocyclaceae bacterium]|jgi:hypothetical protein|nr:hypothetical protein [Rhodocyclaceae bacterium]